MKLGGNDQIRVTRGTKPYSHSLAQSDTRFVSSVCRYRAHHRTTPRQTHKSVKLIN